MFKRRLKVLFMILLTLLALAIAFLCFERFRGQISLTRYQQKLIAKGEKLTPQELLSPAPKVENGAPELFAAIQRLKEGKILPNNYPPSMHIMRSGRAVVGFRLEMWVEDKVTNRWDQLAEDLKVNKSTFAQIYTALDKQRFDNQLDYTLGPKMLFPHLAPAKSLTQWLRAAGQLALRRGDTQEAVNPLTVQIRIPKALAEDRIVISELVRIAIAAIAKTATWEALQADGWGDGDLPQLQTAWEEQSFMSNMVYSLQGELVFGQVAFDLVRKSNEEAVGILYGLEEYLSPEELERPWWERKVRLLPGGDSLVDFLKKQVYCRVWRFAWAHQNQRHYLQRLQRLIEITRDAAAGKSFDAVQDTISQFVEECQRTSLYDRLRYPNPDSGLALSKCVSRAMRAETDRSMTICAIALKRHQLRFGKLPTTLDSLVPEFLTSVPIDYMDGKPMKYSVNPDGSFTLYSVGEDGKDDGGDTTMLLEKTSTRNLWDRRDVVWPAPALPEEVEAYRKESAGL